MVALQPSIQRKYASDIDIIFGEAECEECATLGKELGKHNRSRRSQACGSKEKLLESGIKRESRT
jgi:hypothetical protein